MTQNLYHRAFKTRPNIKNTWEFCSQFESCEYIKNSVSCGVLKIGKLFWMLRIEYETLRMRAMVRKVLPSSHSKILDYCFVISNDNVRYGSSKHIYGSCCFGKLCLSWNPTKRSPNMALYLKKFVVVT